MITKSFECYNVANWIIIIFIIHIIVCKCILYIMSNISNYLTLSKVYYY